MLIAFTSVSLRRVVVMVAFVASCASAVRAENWPMWRGPNGDGVSQSKDAPLRWSEKDNVAWKTAIPGVGYSSPIVWDQSIFLTSADLDSKERLLFCADRETGNIRWQRTVATAEIEQMHRMNSPASGTPATDGERVFVMFQVERKLLVAAYDFSGELLWRQIPGAFVSRHGFNTCPVIYKDSIIISGIQDGPDAFVARLKGDTGEILWKTPISDPIRSFSTPLVIQVDGRDQIVLSGANPTCSFDGNSGDLIWWVDGPAEKTVSSLIYDGKLLFVAGGRDNQLFAIRPTGKGNVTESHIEWVATRGIPYINSPILSGDVLHVIGDNGIYSRLASADGQLL